MIAPFLKALSFLLNQKLQYDEDFRSLASELSGKTLQIQISDWKQAIWVKFEKTRMTISSGKMESATASITGSLEELIQLTKQATPSLGKGVLLSGDLHFVQTVGALFKSLEVEWEFLLTHYLGDNLGYALFRTGKAGVHLAKQTRDSLSQDIGEFLREEGRWVVGTYSLEDFSHQVTHFRDGVDRLAARVRRVA